VNQERNNSEKKDAKVRDFLGPNFGCFKNPPQVCLSKTTFALDQWTTMRSALTVEGNADKQTFTGYLHNAMRNFFLNACGKLGTTVKHTKFLPFHLN